MVLASAVVQALYGHQIACARRMCTYVATFVCSYITYAPSRDGVLIS